MSNGKSRIYQIIDIAPTTWTVQHENSSFRGKAVTRRKGPLFLLKILNRVAMVLTSSSYDTNADYLFERLGWKKLTSQRTSEGYYGL